MTGRQEGDGLIVRSVNLKCGDAQRGVWGMISNQQLNWGKCRGAVRFWDTPGGYRESSFFPLSSLFLFFFCVC